MVRPDIYIQTLFEDSSQRFFFLSGNRKFKKKKVPSLASHCVGAVFLSRPCDQKETGQNGREKGYFSKFFGGELSPRLSLNRTTGSSENLTNCTTRM